MTNHSELALAKMGIHVLPAICYSGYRAGQSPILGIYPSYSEILADLSLLQPSWRYLRVYDSGAYAQTLLEVIHREGLPFKVLLGADLSAEVNNPGCPWLAHHPDHILADNRHKNDTEIQRLIHLANRYPRQVLGLSIGNEASVEWTDHKVPTERLVHFARTIKAQTDLPLTFCENYVPWANGDLDELAEHLDIISIHTYPIWESVPIEEALAFSQKNYRAVANRFPSKAVIITEAGWTTQTNGHAFPESSACVELQSQYVTQLLEWSKREGILTFLFEAFDEDWKGSSDPLEPEKHWGIYTIDRTPKQYALERLPKASRLSNNQRVKVR